ncbi:Nup133 N terminal like-domain-containing protein [Phycomyces nitens]|nr:Nup133 N terminal like-domain-containing protein [Phycomyces nitens]
MYALLRRINQQKNEPTTLTPVIDHSVNAGTTLKALAELDSPPTDLINYFKDTAERQQSPKKTETQTELLTIDRHIFPNIFSDAIENMQYQHHMGLMEEIGYLWRTVDNRLIMWNYIERDDVLVHEEQEQPITTVGLVRRKNAFCGFDLTHIIVMATPLQIILLGVTAASANPVNKGYKGNRIQMHSLNVNASANDLCFSEIKGTDDERILLLATDGHLYEMEYHSTGHFSLQGSRLVCLTKNMMYKYLPTTFDTASKGIIQSFIVCNQRKIIYALTSNNGIEVLSTSKRGEIVKRLTQTGNIDQAASRICYQSAIAFYPEDFQLVSIHLISKEESERVHILGVSSTGTRIYFSHLSDMRFGIPLGDNEQPKTIKLAHVILPPNHESQTKFFMIQQDQFDHSKTVLGSYYNKNVFLMAKGSFAGEKTVSATTLERVISTNFANDSNFLTSNYIETTASIEHHETIYGIGEINEALYREASNRLPKWIRQFILLGHSSITTIARERPVDGLHRLILTSLHSDSIRSPELDAFFERYGHAQTCAMCLEIACEESGRKDQEAIALIQKATLVFFEYGGQPSAALPLVSEQNYLGKTAMRPRTKFSVKHDGLGLYLVRLLGPIWKKKIFPISPDGKFKIKTAALLEQLSTVQRKLWSLRHFMKENDLLHKVPKDFVPSAQRDNQLWILDEQMSFYEMSTLMTHTIEAIYFLGGLMETGVEKVYQQLQSPSKEKFTEMTVEFIVATFDGRDLVRDLVIAIINARAAFKNSSELDSVTSLLQKNGDTLFPKKDIAFYKGIETILKAKSAGPNNANTDYMEEVLRYFNEAPNDLLASKFEEVCNEFRKLGWNKAVLDLAISRAKIADPYNNAMMFLENGSNPSNSDAKFYKARHGYYVQVLKTIISLQPTNPRSVFCLSQKSRSLFEAAQNQKEDTVFLYVFYDWLFRNRLYGDLFSLQPDHLLPFVRNYIEHVQGMEFLFQYHLRRDESFEAAFYAHSLAELDPKATLEDRITHLGHASGCLSRLLISGRGTQESCELTKLVEQQQKMLGIQRELRDNLCNQSTQLALTEKDRVMLCSIPMSLKEMFELARRYNYKDGEHLVMSMAEKCKFP